MGSITFRTKIFIKQLIYFFCRFFSPFFNLLGKCKRIYLSQIETNQFKEGGINFSANPPFDVYGEKYMEIGFNFSSKSGLRIECIHVHGSYTPPHTEDWKQFFLQL